MEAKTGPHTGKLNSASLPSMKGVTKEAMTVPKYIQPPQQYDQKPLPEHQVNNYQSPPNQPKHQANNYQSRDIYQPPLPTPPQIQQSNIDCHRKVRICVAGVMYKKVPRN